MITVNVRPARRWLGGRRQWKFDIRAANGERLDPRDTYNNREDLLNTLSLLFVDSPVEVVVWDTDGYVEYVRKLRS